MFVLLTDVEWTPRLLGLGFAVVVGEAVLFSVVGIGQAIAGEIFWNPALELSNDFHFYFRVNSLFWDPNIYGRYLALVAVIVAAAVLWARDARTVAIGAGVLAVILAGLVFGFSQTSFIALLVGVGVVCGLRYSAICGGRRDAGRARAGVRRRGLHRRHLGGRGQRRGGLERAQHPGRGRDGPVRVEAGRRATGRRRSRTRSTSRRASARTSRPISHNEPVTVAAEQGDRRAARLRGGRRRGDHGPAGRHARHRARPRGAGVRDRRPAREPGAQRLARIALAGAFAAMLVHTVGYGAFLTDPITWAILAIGCGAGRPAAHLARDRLPAPPGDDGRGIHGLERPLEADRGRAAAALHALPLARRITAPRRC